LRSSIWIGLKEHVFTIRDNSHWIIDTVTNISFWTDNWLGTTLVDPMNIPESVHYSFKAKVSSFIVHEVSK
jgi:hypothetical protein